MDGTVEVSLTLSRTFQGRLFPERSATLASNRELQYFSISLILIKKRCSSEVNGARSTLKNLQLSQLTKYAYHTVFFSVVRISLKLEVEANKDPLLFLYRVCLLCFRSDSGADSSPFRRPWPVTNMWGNRWRRLARERTAYGMGHVVPCFVTTGVSKGHS